ncbi:hypothetical protein [Gaopeijia maritima]|uniref:Uncharacterized protein n=1 Tax=Gaopeijia maritima TaxID=3119007 RepID=A0ABU9ECN6_9BACT
MAPFNTLLTLPRRSNRQDPNTGGTFLPRRLCCRNRNVELHLLAMIVRVPAELLEHRIDYPGNIGSLFDGTMDAPLDVDQRLSDEFIKFH